MRSAAAKLTLVMAVALAACAGDDASAPDDTQVATATTVAPDAPTSAPAAVATTVPPTTAVAPTTSLPPTTTAAPTTTLPPTTTSPPTTTTTSPSVAGLATDARQVLEIGRSRQDRPIVAVQRGTPGGTVVLVIGVIHGNEDDGVPILEQLATAPVPDGVDLWLLESMNPDGQALAQRGNADGVDLNRNFPHRWGPIGAPGDDQYAGPGPASEPETQAVVDFVSAIRPELTLWYHQDLFRLSPGEGLEGRVKQRYAELTGLPILRITGGTYTGVAATWQRNVVGGISFIVELGPSLTADEVGRHRDAVLDVAALVAAA